MSAPQSSKVDALRAKSAAAKAKKAGDISAKVISIADYFEQACSISADNGATTYVERYAPEDSALVDAIAAELGARGLPVSQTTDGDQHIVTIDWS